MAMLIMHYNCHMKLSSIMYYSYFYNEIPIQANTGHFNAL